MLAITCHVHLERVDEPRNDGLAGDVDDPRIGWTWARSGRTDRHDPIVANNHVGVLDDFPAIHRDGSGAAEHQALLRRIAPSPDPDPVLGGLGRVEVVDRLERLPREPQTTFEPRTTAERFLVGSAAVARMNQAGMAVDLSHCG